MQSKFEVQARLEGYRHIAGVDEAGRGPLAGPLVVASCILSESLPFTGIKDSKKLSSQERERLFGLIQEHALSFSVVVLEPSAIDEINIFQATLLGMKQAVESMSIQPDFVLVDGKHVPKLSMPSLAIVKGDDLSYTIAAASILAKVTRDRMMVEAHKQWPDYGFAVHKGYPTKAHLEALQRLGVTPIHRRSYAPVRNCL